MSLPLDRQTVWLTGAAQGLGAAVARHLAGCGARLVLMDRDGPALGDVCAACGPGTRGLAVDLCDAAATGAAIADAMAGGAPDTVIHNAAILVPTPFGQETLEGFRHVLDVGLQAAFQLARAAWPGMVARRGGTLVFVSSRSGIEGFADEAAYCAAKHGLEGLSKSLALEGAPHGIMSCTLTPGHPMRTPMSERTYTPDMKRAWVEPDRLAPAFARLCERRDTSVSGRRLSAWEYAAGA